MSTPVRRKFGVCKGLLCFEKTTDYCVLVGDTMTRYVDISAYSRGDHPTVQQVIVGASAWNPTDVNTLKAEVGNDTSFRLVTSQGTHLNCSASSEKDRDVWLKAFHAGLEASYNRPKEYEKSLLKPPPPITGSKAKPKKQTIYCRSCGRLENPQQMFMRLASSPLPQYGIESRVDLCPECLVSQGVLTHLQILCCLYESEVHERSALATARDIALKTVQDASPPVSDEDKCHKDDNNSGSSNSTDEHASTGDAATTGDQSSWTQVGSDASTTDEGTARTNMSGSWMLTGEETTASQEQYWINLPPTAESTKALLSLMKSAGFGSYRRICPLLDLQCRRMEAGDIGCAAEFFAALDESRGNDGDEMGSLKKEALMIAGDMGAAMKSLQDNAIVQSNDDVIPSHHTDMLSCILEFFLDLCDEGEVSSVAFFWPQLQCIHLRMLPPKDANELARVELMEDFLLTMCTKYSVQLAIELVWGHVADLEDSLCNTNCAPACRRRRFSVMRFLCELESLLFDFDGAWGGGSVSLRGMLTPSKHQVSLLKDCMNTLNGYRKKRSISPCLSRSVRMDKLKEYSAKFTKPPEEAAREALRIAKNADYFSSHLSFTRRLSDIAEKLRFMEVEKRHAHLDRELDLLNSSGGMGGDPLNRTLEKNALMRVVRVPRGEGHVFRSKERTPVLLLVEVTLDEDCIPDLAPTKNNSSEETITLENEKELMVVPVERNDELEVNTNAEDGKKDDIDVHSEKHDAVVSEQKGNKEVGNLLSTEGIENERQEESAPTSVDEPEELPAIELDEESVLKSPKRKTLVKFKSKRFEAEGGDPTSDNDAPNKEDVENLVTSMMNQLHVPQLDVPDLDESNCAEAQSDAQNVEEDKEKRLVEADESEKELNSSSSQLAFSSDDSRRRSRSKMSAFGSFSGGGIGDTNDNSSGNSNDIRRDVLATIMDSGKRGKNVIAKGAAATAQKNLQALDRKRAVELLLEERQISVNEQGENEVDATNDSTSERNAEKLKKALDTAEAEVKVEDSDLAPPTEEDEAIESLRLLLLQNRVAKGSMSPESAALALSPTGRSSLVRINSSKFDEETFKVNDSDMPQIDAGDIDPRLAGCGPLPPAVLQALTLWKGGVVTEAELLELVKKDLQYLRVNLLPGAENQSKLIEDSQFWGRFAFGERWAEKKARIGATSPKALLPEWDLVGVIVKSNDDLRQEAFVMQLISLCQEAFDIAGLELWVQPYRILATGRTTGIIEMVRNAMSFDALKKRPGYGKSGLRGHLERMAEVSADPEEALRSAQHNFVRSLAAYSLMSYLFLFKDRHNGNLLLDTAGHVIHIDFGFVFGVAPGGSFSLELSTPFKLTEEMLEVMGGLNSALFSEFVTLFCCGFLALQAHVDTFSTVVEITCHESSFKCFEGKEPTEIVSQIRERLCVDSDKEKTLNFAMDLIHQSVNSSGTRQYDYYQWLSQGIAS